MIIDTLTRALSEAMGWLFGGAGSALSGALAILPTLPDMGGFVTFYSLLNEVFPLTEIATLVALVVAVRAASLTYMAAKEGASWIPFINVGK